MADPLGVSFVIPVLDEEAGLAPFLTSLRARFPGAELVVVDGGSRDRSVSIALARANLVLVERPGRARQMNLGGQLASGRHLCFLHADSLPGIDAARLQSRLSAGPAWGFCRVRLSGTHPAFRLIEAAMNLRSRLTRVATGDQMLFIRRDVFRATGGFSNIPLMEDIEYCKRLRRLEPPLVVSEPVLTSSRRWERAGIVATVVRMWALRLAWFLGVSPERLWRHYYSPGTGQG